MTALSKTLLVLSVSGIIVGCIAVFGNIATNNIGLLMAMPLGAVASGLFLISYMMEREMNQFDQEEAKKRRVVQPHKAPQVPERTSKAPPASATLQKAIL